MTDVVSCPECGTDLVRHCRPPSPSCPWVWCPNVKCGSYGTPDMTKWKPEPNKRKKEQS